MWFHTGRVVSYSRLVGMGLGSVTAGERQWGHRLRAWRFLWILCVWLVGEGSEWRSSEGPQGQAWKWYVSFLPTILWLELMAPSNHNRQGTEASRVSGGKWKGAGGTHSAVSGTKANFVKVGEVLTCLSILDAAAGRSPEVQRGVKNWRFFWASVLSDAPSFHLDEKLFWGILKIG